ncbi:MAG TPA: MFS transporter [Gaiellaceae bacterium]|nr:MFS transporter [Gaiellaceae bacterium]
MRAELDKRAMTALSAGHLATDFAGGALPALLPFLVDRFDLNYAMAALAMLASAASSSLIQPLFGLWSDRRGAIWLLPTGVAIAGVGIALAAASPSYWLVLLFVLISGLGVAAFHPEGSKFAAYASGNRRASGMSFFSIGGNLGYALGPIVTTPLVIAFGLTGGLLVALPCLLVAAMLLRVVPFLSGFAPESGRVMAASGERDRVGALVLLLAVIAFRSVAWFGLITFVPLWEVSIGNSAAHGNHLLSLMLLAGGLGTIAAGPIADRVGRRPVVITSMFLVCPLIVVYVLVGGVIGAVALACVGICVIGTFGVTMVLSQEYLPTRIGMASGLAIGLSIGLGGIAAVALGALADSIDLQAAMYAAAAAAVPGFVLATMLPASRARRPLAPEPVL